MAGGRGRRWTDVLAQNGRFSRPARPDSGGAARRWPNLVDVRSPGAGRGRGALTLHEFGPGRAPHGNAPGDRADLAGLRRARDLPRSRSEHWTTERRLPPCFVRLLLAGGLPAAWVLRQGAGGV